MSKQEQEQLLQDALTLLMFANVAARQQGQQPSEPTTAVPTPKTAPAAPFQFPLQPAQDPTQPHLHSRPPIISQAPQPHPSIPPQIPQSHPHIPSQYPLPSQYPYTLRSPPVIHPSTNVNTASTVLQPIHQSEVKREDESTLHKRVGLGENEDRQVKRSKTSLDSIMNTKSETPEDQSERISKDTKIHKKKSMEGNTSIGSNTSKNIPMNSTPAVATVQNSHDNITPENITPTTVNATPNSEKSNTTIAATPHTTSPAVAHDKSPASSNENPQTQPVASPKAPKSSRSSISALINAEPAPPVPLVHDTKAVLSVNTPKEDFKVHQRSKSNPDTVAQGKFVKLSPGPGLARGINLTTGERNNNNAMIAAAALAAAADIPLPLKVVSPRKDEMTEDEEKTEDESKNEPKSKKDRTKVERASEALNEKVNGSGEVDAMKTTEKVTDSTKVTDPSTTKENINTKEKVNVDKAEVTSDHDVSGKEETKEKEHNTLSKPETVIPEPMEIKADQEAVIEEPQNTDESKKVDLEANVPSTLTEEAVAEPNNALQDTHNENKLTTFVAPPLETYQVDPDSGLIGCICEIDDDDGFTIQCDVCFRWQHCLCMGFMTSEEVPEAEYQCYYCDKAKWGKFNAEDCRQQTLDRLDPDKPDTTAETITSENANAHELRLGDLASAKRKRLSSEKTEKKRKLDIIRKEATPEAVLAPEDTLPNKDNELLHDGVTAELYQSVYFNLKSNDFKRPSIRAYFEEWGRRFKDRLDSGSPLQAVPEVKVMSLSDFNSRPLSKIVLPNFNKYLHEHNILKKNKSNGTSIQVKPYTDNQKQKFNGISKLALFISAPGTEQYTIPAGTPIIEYLGELNFFNNYANEGTNQYSSWGTTKPRVLKSLIPSADGVQSIVLDSRFVGNESRFLRKLCPAASNCAIERVFVPETNTLHFFVVTSKPIELKSELAEEELRLPWEWDRTHPIHKLYSSNGGEKFENLLSSDKSTLITCIDNLLHFAECGCSTSNVSNSCAILKVKRATSYLLRSTRKVSSISNVNLAKSKEELIFPKKEKEYVPWSARFAERDRVIQMNLLVSSDKMKEQEDKSVSIQDLQPQGQNTKATVLFKLPYKHQLAARQKEFLKEVHRKGQQEANDDDKLDLFPVVPEVLVKIEESLTNKLQTRVAEIGLGIKDADVDREKKLDTTEKDEGERKEKVLVTELPSHPGTALSMSPPEKQPEERPKEEAEAKPAPKIVKKLSFADYKKKMK